MNNRVLPAFIIIVAVGIFLAYVDPTWNGPIAAARTAIAADDQAMVAANQYLSQQNQLAAARDAIDPKDLARLGTFLPDSVDNVGLILDLNALAARSQLSLSNIDVSTNGANGVQSGAVASGTLQPSEASQVGSADLSLSASGTFTALNAFLSGVESSVRLLDIRDFAITSSDTGIYNYKMTLRFYWLR